MRITPLIVLVMLLLQTSVSFSAAVKNGPAAEESDCRVLVERSSTNQTERLMNQYYLGQIGGLEFEQKRSAILSQTAVEREVCEQKILAVQPQQEYFHTITSSTRSPASVDIGDPNTSDNAEDTDEITTDDGAEQ